MYEVFDPRNGTPVYTVRSRLLARLLSWWIGGDYERPGVGWTR